MSSLTILMSARVLLLLSCMPGFSQTKPALTFEVADVKANHSGEGRMLIDIQPGGRVTMRNVPMKVLIALAYHVRPEGLAGGPAWMESERFDVVAKAPQTASSDDVRLMVQSLLAERFKLVTHTEQMVRSAFALGVGKMGPKLQPSEMTAVSATRCVPVGGQPDQKHMECRQITMGVLADYLQEMAPLDFPEPVVDQTGLKGAYNFKLDWMPTKPTAAAPVADDSATAPPAQAGPSIFDAVEVQLGLRLERKRLPLPVIVVDSVLRVPTEN
jgi:uncharacterized protein (TIGR03435 family)